MEKTAMQELKEVLEREIGFVGNLHDTEKDKTVASYLKTVIAEIDNRFIEKEKQQIITAADTCANVLIANDIVTQGDHELTVGQNYYITTHTPKKKHNGYEYRIENRRN